MAQQISDLVINLDVDSASFSEQVARIRGQLKGMADESDKSHGRMERAAQIQAAALKQMGEAGAKAAREIQANQSTAADEMAAAWNKSSLAVDETHRRVAEFNKKLQETASQTAATGRQQDELAEAFYREIDSVQRLTGETLSLTSVQKQLRAARAQGAISQQDYLALVSQTTVRQKELNAVEQKASRDKERFIQQLKEQVDVQNLSRTELLRLKAAQLGVSDAAESYIRKLEGARGATNSLNMQSEAAKRAGISVSRYSSAMRQLPAQLTDIVTQLAGGQSPFMILLQQGGQIKDSFGGFGAMFRALREALFGFNDEVKESSDEAKEGVGDLAESLNNTSEAAENFGRVRGIFTPLNLSILGIIATVGMLTYAWYKGAKESEILNKSLISTGNYAGLTAGQLNKMARALSEAGSTQRDASAALAMAVNTGRFRGSQLETVTAAALAMEEATGKAVDETIKNFQRLYDSPAKGSAELNSQLHYLTASQFQYISGLEQRGEKEAAGQAAAEAYSRAEQQRSQQILDNLNLFERMARGAGDAFKGMWDNLLNIGRAGSDADVLQTMKDTLAELQENGKQGLWGRFKNNTLGVDKSQLEENIKKLEFVVKSQDGYNQKKDEFNQINKNGIDAQISFNKYLDAGTTQTEKRALAQRELNKAIADNAKAAKATQTLAVGERVKLWSPEEIAKARDGIEKLYKDPKTAKAKGYVPPAGDRAEDNNQRDLLALQSQLEVLKQHKSVTDSISQQRKELWTALAQFTVLEDAARTRQLSKQEQSLLASKKQVLQLANQKAILGDQIVAQEQLNKRMDTASKYVTQMAEKQSALANSATMSDRMAGRESTFAQLRSGWLNSGGSLKDAGYQQQLKAAKDYYAAEDQLRGDWKAGVEKSWADYSDAATNSYEQMKNVGGAVLNGASSQLASFLTRSGASFKDFTKSILSMLAEILVKMSLVNGVKGASNFFGLEFNASGGVYNSSSLSAYSGSIVDRPTFFAFAKGGGVMGEAGPEAILPLRRGANGKLGVVAGNTGGGNPVFNNTIILQSDGTATSQTSGGSDAMNQAMMKMLDQFCQNNLVKAIRPGGLIFNAMKSR